MNKVAREVYVDPLDDPGLQTLLRRVKESDLLGLPRKKYSVLKIARTVEAEPEPEAPTEEAEVNELVAIPEQPVTPVSPHPEVTAEACRRGDISPAKLHFAWGYMTAEFHNQFVQSKLVSQGAPSSPATSMTHKPRSRDKAEDSPWPSPDKGVRVADTRKEQGLALQIADPARPPLLTHQHFPSSPSPSGRLLALPRRPVKGYPLWRQELPKKPVGPKHKPSPSSPQKWTSTSVPILPWIESGSSNALAAPTPKAVVQQEQARSPSGSPLTQAAIAAARMKESALKAQGSRQSASAMLVKATKKLSMAMSMRENAMPRSERVRRRQAARLAKARRQRQQHTSWEADVFAKWDAIPDDRRTTEMTEEFLENLSKCEFLMDLGHEQRIEIARRLRLFDWGDKDNIFVPGAMGEVVFIVVDGTVNEMRAHMGKLHLKRKLTHGLTFGISGLPGLRCDSSNRGSLFQAQGPTRCLTLAHQHCTRLFRQWADKEISSTFALLKSSPVFDSACDEVIRKVSYLFTVERYSKGEVLYEQGVDRIRTIYWVVEGECRLSRAINVAVGGEVKKHPVDLNILGPREFFGEAELFVRRTGYRNCSVTVTSRRLLVLEIPRQIFLDHLPTEVLGAIQKYSTLRANAQNKRIQLAIEFLKSYGWHLATPEKEALLPPCVPASLRPSDAIALVNREREEPQLIGPVADAIASGRTDIVSKGWGLFGTGGWTRVRRLPEADVRMQTRCGPLLQPHHYDNDPTKLQAEAESRGKSGLKAKAGVSADASNSGVGAAAGGDPADWAWLDKTDGGAVTQGAAAEEGLPFATSKSSTLGKKSRKPGGLRTMVLTSEHNSLKGTILSPVIEGGGRYAADCETPKSLILATPQSQHGGFTRGT